MSDNAYLEYPSRFHNFIVFEPASLRVHDCDILLIGDDVRQFFDQLMAKVLSQESTLKVQILHNKLVKIGHMLELLTHYDQVIITRYFDRIWRRYGYISHLGESFLNLDVLYGFFPDYQNEDSIIASRYGELNEESAEDTEEDSDDDSDETSDDTHNVDEDNTDELNTDEHNTDDMNEVE